ncbi:MAG: hypothetical protein ABIQ30_09225 [Devosia sp.]
MFPRVVVRVKKAMRRLTPRFELVEPSGAQIEASWEQMIYEVRVRDRNAERRIIAAERALNRLTMS